MCIITEFTGPTYASWKLEQFLEKMVILQFKVRINF